MIHIFSFSGMANLWSNNLDQFLYYCCPECNDFRSKDKDIFIGHALTNHPEVRIDLSSIIFLIPEIYFYISQNYIF